MSLMQPAAQPGSPELPIPGEGPATPPGGPDGAARAADRADRTERGGGGDETGIAGPAEGAGSGGRGGRRPRTSIGLKMGALLTALLVVFVGSSVVLILENRATARGYDALLGQEVRQSLLARQMQVEFKKRVQEWKDILLRGSDPVDLATYRSRFDAEDVKTDGLYHQLLASTSDPALKAQLLRYNQLESVVDTAYDRALTAFVASGGQDFKAADQTVRGVDRPATDQVDRIVAGLESRVAQRIAAQQRLTAERQQLTLVLAGCLLVLLSAVLGLALIRIVRPIRALTRQAELVAGDRLPSAVARIKAMDLGENPPALPAFTVSSRDELHDLAAALTSLQDNALAQAVEQHRSDRETADMLVNLGRRNQNLLGRMLSYVTELERKEQDPDVLSQLFRLDHATTRIRRNAESMLVLAGATQTRTWSRPVPVIDVVRAALSEIEEYIRVDLHHVEDSLVNGSAVADVVHLIAELVENATHFSPPATQVTVVGQLVREGYRVRVIDQGVGMTRRELDDANARIRRAEGGWSDSKLLGLYVVGRLARRRGIEVSLEPSAGRGITASILLPLTLLGASPAGGASSVADARARSAAAGAPASGSLPALAGPPVPAPLSSAGARPAASILPPAPSARMASSPPPVSSPPVSSPPLSSPPASAPVPSAPASAGWAASTTPGAEPWATLVPPAPAEPSSRPGIEFGTFTASARPPAGPGQTGDQPRPTLPAALTSTVGSAPVERADEPKRVIDLTEAGRGGCGGVREPFGTAPLPARWFAGEGAQAPRSVTTPATRPTVTTPNGSPIPRRVRGAQLPDLGPAAEPVLARPDDGPGAAESLRWQLRSFQLDVQAARRAISDGDPAAEPAPSGNTAPPSEQSEPIHGHHHPEGE